MRVSHLFPFFKVSEVVRETRQRRRPEGGNLKGCCVVFIEKLYLIDQLFQCFYIPGTCCAAHEHWK